MILENVECASTNYTFVILYGDGTRIIVNGMIQYGITKIWTHNIIFRHQRMYFGQDFQMDAN